MDLKAADKFFTPDTQFAWIFDGTDVSTCRLTLFNSSYRRKKEIVPQYGRSNKGVSDKIVSYFPISTITHTNIGTGRLGSSWVINIFKMDGKPALWIL
jgi:hypothetical protein